MRLVIMGAPGAGKGTQGSMISRRLSIPTISTGAIIRKNIKEETAFGKEAEEYIRDGGLVPDELMINLVKSRIEEPDCINGYILDGFPRTVAQAQALDKWGVQIDVVLMINVSDEEIIRRLAGRRECSNCNEPYHIGYRMPKVAKVCDKCGGEIVRRKDDNPATIKKRLKIFHTQTKPICEYYKRINKLVEIEGKEQISDTKNDVAKALGI